MPRKTGRRRSLSLAVALMALVGCAGSPPAASRSPVTLLERPVATTAAPVPASSHPPTATASGLGTQWPRSPEGATDEAQLVRIIDGDTIRALVGGVEYRVRYIGVNTPEIGTFGGTPERLGAEATVANARLLDAGLLLLERDVSETDRFGRLLRYVWTRDDSGVHTLVNGELVRLGYAQVATYPPDVRYVDAFLAAQRDARDAGRGLWGVP